jgi:hypothetical protein
MGEKERSSFTSWRRKTEAILCIPFAVKHGDEELKPHFVKIGGSSYPLLIMYSY